MAEPRRLPTFLMLFLPSFFLLVLLLFTFQAMNSRNKLTLIRQHEASCVEAARKIIQQEFQSIASDLFFLASSHTFEAYLNSPGPQTRERLNEKLLELASTKRKYLQVHCLDPDGRETHRIEQINHDTLRVATASELRDQPARPFFAACQHLQRGELFVTTILPGKAPNPAGLVVRLATPLFDRQGAFAGVLALDYGGEMLLSYIGEAFAPCSFMDQDLEEYSHPFLLTDTGYLLAGPTSKEIAALFAGHAGRFEGPFPTAWQTISRSFHGQLLDSNGLFSHATILPPASLDDLQLVSLLPPAAGSISFHDGQHHWKLVSLISREKLADLTRPDLIVTLLLLLLLLGLSGYVCWRLTAMRHDNLRTEALLRRSEEKFRTVSDFTYSWEYWLGPTGKFIYMSPSCERISGYPPDAFMDDPGLLTRIIHPDDRQGFLQHLKNEFDCSRICLQDFRIITRDGQERWIGHICQPIFNSEGSHMGRRASNRDITTQVAAEQRLMRQAYYDPLTNLPNRNLLTDRLQQTIGMASRNGQLFAVLFLDLDNFKTINDQAGHEAGDMILAEVARRLLSCVRKTDTIARLAGDEFVILLPKITSIDNATAIADKVIDCINKPFTLVDGSRENLGVSIGISFYPEHGTTQNMLIKAADNAMYRAKDKGKNCYSLAD